MDLERVRRETPGCERRIHLNNAGASLMPEPVLEAVQRHLRLEAEIGGYEAAEYGDEVGCTIEGGSSGDGDSGDGPGEMGAAAIRAAYEYVAELLGTRSENVAFTDNATASFVQALSSVPFEEGDVILTTQNDYVSNQIQLLSLQQRLGVRVLRVPDRREGGVDIAAFEELLGSAEPKLVCLTHIPTSSGLVQDAAAVGRACHRAGVLYLVDACQSVGQMPVDVKELQCDFLSATSRKFLRGPRGAGFLYVSDRALDAGFTPLFVDLRGATWTDPDTFSPAPGAKRFETWEFAWALVVGTGVAARYALDLGLDRIRDRVRSLAAFLRELLREEGLRVLDRGEALGGIVTLWVDGWEPRALVRALRRRGVNTSAQTRSTAVLDFDDKGVSGCLRLSPHYFNTEDEILRTVKVLKDVAS